MLTTIAVIAVIAGLTWMHERDRRADSERREQWREAMAYLEEQDAQRRGE